MKKTLVALAVTAFAASASAVTVYENEGTTVNFDGSVRLVLSKSGGKTTTPTSGGVLTTKNAGHSNLKDGASRFIISAKHNITDDFHAVGLYETRFGSGSANASGWGDITTNKAYVGLGGHGSLVTFGKQNVIGDSIGQAGYDNKLDVGSANIKRGFDVLTTSSDSAVNYTFTGVKGLTLGANYNFANARKSGEVVTPNFSDTDADGNPRNPVDDVVGKNAKSGFGLGAVYSLGVAEGQTVTFATGYTHDDFVAPAGDVKKVDKDGVYVGVKYNAGLYEVALDLGRGVQKVKEVDGVGKSKLNFLRTGARVNLGDAGVYANYSYGTVKQSHTGDATTKNTAHQFMLGSDYKVHKHVKTYIEGRLTKQKDNFTTAQNQFTKTTDKAFAVGLNVFW